MPERSTYNGLLGIGVLAMIVSVVLGGWLRIEMLVLIGLVLAGALIVAFCALALWGFLSKNTLTRRACFAFVAQQGWKLLEVPQIPNQFFQLEKTRLYERTLQRVSVDISADTITPELLAVMPGLTGGIFGFGYAAPDTEKKATPLIYVRADIHGSLQGWARLRPETSAFRGSIKETDLESISFNKEMQVHAYPPKLAFSVFTPDFMDWYTRLSFRPWIMVRDGMCAVIIERARDFSHVGELLGILTKVVEYIEKSGALEKPLSK